jgi:hypothetical protein
MTLKKDLKESFGMSLTIVLSALLIVAYASYFGPNQFAIFNLAFGADVDGNDIDFTEVWQNNGSYQLIVNWTSDPAGASAKIEPNQEIRFNISMKCNNTDFPNVGNVTAYTSCYMNISYGVGPTYIWNNATLNATGSPILIGSFYHQVYQGDWNTTLPTTGVMYLCEIRARWRY